MDYTHARDILLEATKSSRLHKMSVAQLADEHEIAYHSTPGNPGSNNRTNKVETHIEKVHGPEILQHIKDRTEGADGHANDATYHRAGWKETHDQAIKALRKKGHDVKSAITHSKVFF